MCFISQGLFFLVLNNGEQFEEFLLDLRPCLTNAKRNIEELVRGNEMYLRNAWFQSIHVQLDRVGLYIIHLLLTKETNFEKGKNMQIFGWSVRSSIKRVNRKVLSPREISSKFLNYAFAHYVIQALQVLVTYTWIGKLSDRAHTPSGTNRELCSVIEFLTREWWLEVL